MKNKFPCIMKTLAVLTTLTAAILTALFCCLRQDWLLTLAISFGTTAYHFVMRLLVGYIVPRVTNYGFDYHAPWFQPQSWEPSFYKRIGIKNWKKNLPTYAPGQFSLADNTLHRILQNMCGAEVVHEVIMLLSFLPLLTIPVFGSPGVFLITSVMAAGFDGIFVMAQRYNRPRLIYIMEKQRAKAPLCKGSCKKSTCF